MKSNQRSLRTDKRAASPAISTIILTAAGIAIIFVALTFANDFLNKNMAQNEFSMNKQFMQTTGLQLDDVAWTIGRTQTITYSSTYGNLTFQPVLLNYCFQQHINATNTWQNLTVQTGAIIYNMPVTSYSMGNNYFSQTNSLLLTGSSAPVSQVYCVEKLPMPGKSYFRIVVMPTIRMINSSISANYLKFYLPTLDSGNSPYKSQSLTLTGNSVSKNATNGVDKVIITVSFPQASSLGFSSSFFNFKNTSITLNASNSRSNTTVTELYVGKVLVSIGQV
jgi:hypothetical protein